MSNSAIALYAQAYPTPGKESRVLTLLQNGARNFYSKPENKCTSWSYFVPWPPRNPPQASSRIAGIEIYTSKQALTTQLEDKEFFQAYHDTIKRENLYARPEELTALYFAGGFLTRSDDMPAGAVTGGHLISVTRLRIKGGEEGRRQCIRRVLGPFAQWVEREERREVLTYAIFTRKKDEGEVVLWVRYRDEAGFKSHADHPEHGKVVRELVNVAEGDLSKATTVWQEVEGSFVSETEGGGMGAKL